MRDVYHRQRYGVRFKDIGSDIRSLPFQEIATQLPRATIHPHQQRLNTIGVPVDFTYHDLFVRVRIHEVDGRDASLGTVWRGADFKGIPSAGDGGVMYAVVRKNER